jgi:hypothetical protein
MCMTAPFHADLTVDLSRTIRREFEGQWRLDVRREVGPDQWEWVCATDWNPQHYVPGAVLADPRDVGMAGLYRSALL